MKFTVLFPYCGIGGGALGFLRAKERIRGEDHEFVSIGGIDIDPLACKDFERLTGSEALCADMRKVSPELLRAFAGQRRPDIIFGSPPCKGMSGLLGEEKSKTPKYQELNRLVVVWIKLMFATWGSDLPPLVLLENVPRIRTRGRALLDEVIALLKGAGYEVHEGVHDCGEIGGLAQRRKRYLLVARLPSAAPALLYEPRKKRVLGCGEVLETLPLPGTPSAGPLHRLPALSLLNWVRIACVPPGGDWHDLPASVTPKALNPDSSFHNNYTVGAWDQPARTIAGATDVQTGAPCVADPRVRQHSASGRAYNNVWVVVAWSEPVPAIAGGTGPSSGASSLADPRLTCTPRDSGGAYGVLPWSEPARCVTGSLQVDNGVAAIADERVPAQPWPLPEMGAGRATHGTRTAAPKGRRGAPSRKRARKAPAKAKTRTKRREPVCGFWAVSDPRVPGSPALTLRWYAASLKSTPPFAPVFATADGSWHRPLTTLELAVLQGLPPTLNGEPLTLVGRNSSDWRERIGNMVPVGAAHAIARQMLFTLVYSASGGFALASPNDGPVWVEGILEGLGWAQAPRGEIGTSLYQ